MVRGLLAVTLALATAAGVAAAHRGTVASSSRIPGEQNRIVDLGSAGTIRLTVPQSGRRFAWNIQSVAVVGDVNGDGVPDIAVGVDRENLTNAHCCGCPREPAPPIPHTDFVQVVFGGSLPATIDLSKPYARGFRIAGAPSGSDLGASLAGAGDVNGDGLGDLVIGAPGFDPGSPGGAFVVYGKRSTAPVDLATLGTGGFQIVGSPTANQAGSIVAGGGDVNGDGRPDVLIGATWRTPDVTHELQTLCGDYLYSPPADSQRTVAYAVFGGARTGAVDLGNLGADGFEIEPSTTTEDVDGNWLANAGDVNGDGRADIAIGTARGALVVFGKASTTAVDPDALGDEGMVIGGLQPTNQDSPDVSVAGVGDVNGDGLADLAVGRDIGTNYPVGSAEADAPSAWVVFGRRSSPSVDLTKLGDRGFAIDGTRDHAASEIVALGDVNGDGLADIGELASGRSLYVIYGKSSSSAVRLYSLGDDGARVDGHIYDAGGVERVAGGKLVLVSTGGELDLVPFAPTIEPPPPRLAGKLSLAGPVVGLTQGLGSVWLLATSHDRSPILFDGEHELLYRLDPATNRLVGRPVEFAGPSRVVATALGSVWVLVAPPSRERAATLLRIDPATGRVALRVAVGRKGLPRDQTIPADTISYGLGSLWITYCATRSVYRIDPASGETLASIKIGHCPQALTFAGGEVWVADREDGAVREIDAARNRVVGPPLEVMRDPQEQGPSLGDMLWMGATASGSVWVYDQDDERVVHIDPRTRRVTFDDPDGTRSFVAVASGSSLWLAGWSFVSRVSIADGKLVGGSLEYDTDPVGAAATGDSVWTTTLGGGLAKFDAR